MKRSLAVRLAAMFALCATAVFALGAVLLHASLNAALDRQLRDELLLRASLIQSVVGRVDTQRDWSQKVIPKLEAIASTHGGTRIWIEGDARYGYGQVPPPLVGKVVQPAGFASTDVPGETCPVVTLVQALPALGDRPPLRLVLARDSTPFGQTAASFRAALVVVMTTGVLVVAVLGYWIARVGLLPLARLSRQARALSPTNRAQRLGFDPMPAELSHLSESFNGALARLERAYEQLEAFNADVAHELRTPLSNLVGQTQVALSRPRKAAELEDVLQSNLEELERMRGIVNDMLFLARADRGALARDAARVSLAEELGKVIEFLEPMIDERRVRVRQEGDAQVDAETSLIRRAASNLLQNAIEHSDDGSEIVVRVGQHGGAPCLTVSNPGVRIEEAHLAHLFERFYRADPSRANSGENHGLGLSIVKAVAAMHRGVVIARSEAGWNTFGFTISPAG